MSLTFFFASVPDFLFRILYLTVPRIVTLQLWLLPSFISRLSLHAHSFPCHSPSSISISVSGLFLSLFLPLPFPTCFLSLFLFSSVSPCRLSPHAIWFALVPHFRFFYPFLGCENVVGSRNSTCGRENAPCLNLCSPPHGPDAQRLRSVLCSFPLQAVPQLSRPHPCFKLPTFPSCLSALNNNFQQSDTPSSEHQHAWRHSRQIFDH